MAIIFLVISLLGISMIYYVVTNYKYLNSEVIPSRDLVIILSKYNVDDVEKEQIVSNIKCGNYSNILEIVDNIRIN